MIYFLYPLGDLNLLAGGWEENKEERTLRSNVVKQRNCNRRTRKVNLISRPMIKMWKYKVIILILGLEQ